MMDVISVTPDLHEACATLLSEAKRVYGDVDEDLLRKHNSPEKGLCLRVKVEKFRGSGAIYLRTSLFQFVGWVRLTFSVMTEVSSYSISVQLKRGSRQEIMAYLKDEEVETWMKQTNDMYDELRSDGLA